MSTVSRYPEISEAERFPLLTPAGKRLLYAMRQHPQAPIWNWPNGEQLDAGGLARVHQFADELNHPRSSHRPDWLDAFTDFCLTQVPFYRRRAAGSPSSTRDFDSQPTCSRSDLAPAVWDFVPDEQSLDQLIVFSTSGTTGEPARMLFDPATAACGVPMMEYALSRWGIPFPRGPEGVAIANVAAYRGAYTTAIVVAYLRESGCVRVNLDESAWRRAGDATAYLNCWKAPIWLGDPIALDAIQKLDTDHAPQAILSSIMRLAPGLRQSLESKYGCPVLDLYAMTEVGILGLGTADGHEVLPHDVYVEIVDEHGQSVADGVRGEVTVTSRRNPFMPLLRYRTGDFASLRTIGAGRVLVDLEGRVPVLFPLASGRVVHCMEITRLVRDYPFLQFQLHQLDTEEFVFRYRGIVDIEEFKSRLMSLLESPRHLRIEELPIQPTNRNQKVIEYQSRKRE